MTELTEFYRERVADFLKTVVCFDDEAYEDAFDNHGAVKAAAKATDGFSTDGVGETASPGDAPRVVACVSDKNSSAFEAKNITDAFADMDILCSVIKPHTDREPARTQIEKLARTADVAIVDWVLKDSQGCPDTSIAREAIVNIVKHDETRNGCLRLIVIYSDQKGEQVIRELAELLSGNGFNHVPGTLELQNVHTLIAFLQKAGASADKGVGYKELPGCVIDAFTRLTSGLLPAAALSAITVIRQHSHHLLATFPATLDGAFLAHRCLIPDPNDAEQFLLDLFEGEIGALLAHSQVRKAVDEARCTAWVEKNEHFDAPKKKCIKKALTKYSKAKIDSFRKLFNNEGLLENDVAEEVLKLLYTGSPDPLALARVREDFSILSTLEAHRRWVTTLDRIPPRLHLGSVVRETDSGRFLLCIQPLCDSTRIRHNRTTIFPFLILAPQSEQKDLDLCIPDEDEEAGVVWLSILPKPQHLISYQFCGKSAAEAYVEAAMENAENGEYYAFRTSDGRCLEWMADLKIGKAQRIVSQLAARIHTLGINEFEWLRLHRPRL
jgi:hypothetical protein